MKLYRFYYLAFFFFCSVSLSAQQIRMSLDLQPYKEVRGFEPVDKSKNNSYAVVEQGDTIPMAYLTSIFVFPKEVFKSAREERYYWKLVRDVKLTYPLSKIVYSTLLETMDYVKTLPDEKSREKHLHQMENDLKKDYGPVLRKMTYSQGKILIKLIYRECNTSPYDLIKAYRGGLTAGIWQGVAKIFSTDLKTGYDPNDKDYMLERVVLKVEQGQL